MSELEEVSFWPGSSSGPYSRLAGSGTGSTCSCRKRTVLIIAAIVLLIYIISVAIPAGLLHKAQKENDAAAAASRGGSTNPPPPPSPKVNTTAVPETTTTVTPTATTTATTTTASPKPPPEFRWNSFRLPKHAVPSKYDLFIDTALTSKSTDISTEVHPVGFSGKVNITLQLKNDTDLIVLHSSGLNITSIKYNSTAATYKLHTEVEQVEITLANELAINTTILLELEFNGQLDDETLRGLYLSTYPIDTSNKVIIASTQFESVFARRAFPCFDEPSFKASFQLTIRRPVDWISLFNTAPVSINNTVDGDPSKREDVYKPSPVMSTYLVAFAICNFARTQTVMTKDNINVTLYARESQVQQLSYAQEVAKLVLEEYTNFFNISYPLEKLDIVAIPNFPAGAMENWGLITFRESDLLYDPKSSSSHTKQLVAGVVAHELAHQWFGNYVTMHWWNELWLNEGFATWVGTFIGMTQVAKQQNESWSMELEFTYDKKDVMELDALTVSKPLSMPEEEVNSAADIEARFDRISYDKGASILQMLDDYVGRNVTQNALIMYINQFKYKTAEAKDLWAAFDKAYGNVNVSISDMMNSWTKSAGYPLVGFSYTDNNKCLFNQTRFYSCLTCNTTGLPASLWSIPVEAVLLDPNRTIKFMLNSSEVSSDLIPDHSKYFFNPSWVGYYIAPQNDLTLGSLSEDVDKINLLQSIKLQFQANKTTADKYLETANAAGNLSIHSAVVYGQGLDLLDYILDFSRDDYSNAAKVQKHVYDYLQLGKIDISYAVFSQLDYYSRRETVRRIRHGLIIDHNQVMEDISMIRNLSKLWADHLFDSTAFNITNVIHNDLFEVVGICAFLTNETVLWQPIWSKYIDSDTTATRQLIYLSILANAQTPFNVQRLLSHVLGEGEVRSESGAQVISWVASNPIGQNLIWHYLRANWDQLLERYRDDGFSMQRIISSAASQFMSVRDLELAKDFFRTHELGAGRNAADIALENIQIAIFVKEKQYPDLVSALLRKASPN